MSEGEKVVTLKQDIDQMRTIYSRPEKFTLPANVVEQCIKDQDKCPYLIRAAEVMDDRVAHQAQPPRQRWDRQIVDLVSRQILVRDDRGLICYHDPYSRKYRVAIPTEHREKMINEAHTEAGHFQMQRVTDDLTLKFWWPHMTADINSNIKGCFTCGTVTGQSRRTTSPLQLLQTLREPGERVHVDILTVPTSLSGLSHILTFTDAYSKNIVAYALKEQTAVYVAKRVVEFMAEYGPPVKIVSDQGGQFMGTVFQELSRIYAFKRGPTTTFQPQSNGQCERANQIILSMLKRSMAENDDTEWPDYLHPCLGLYRAAPHSSTGYSPYYLEHGRPMRLPSDTLFTEVFKEKYEDNPNYIARLSRSIQAAFKEVDENLTNKQAQYKAAYDKRMSKRTVKFAAGDRVWWYDPVAATGPAYKFARPFTGPFLIEQIKGPVTAMIRRIDRKVDTSFITNVNKLRHVAKEIVHNKMWDGYNLEYIAEKDQYVPVPVQAKGNVNLATSSRRSAEIKALRVEADPKSRTLEETPTYDSEQEEIEEERARSEAIIPWMGGGYGVDEADW